MYICPYVCTDEPLKGETAVCGSSFYCWMTGERQSLVTIRLRSTCLASHQYWCIAGWKVYYPVITSLSLTVWDNITWTFCFIYTVLWSVHFVSFYSIFKPVLADRSQFKVCMKQLPASERLPNKTIWRARKVFGEARSKFLAFDEWLRCIAGTKRYQQHWCRREWPATLPRWPTPIMFINSRIVHWRVAQYHRFAEMMIPPIQWKGMLRSFITS